MSEKIDVDSPVVQSHVVLLCPHAPSSTETASRNLGRENILIPSTRQIHFHISVQCQVHILRGIRLQLLLFSKATAKINWVFMGGYPVQGAEVM